MWQVPGGVLLPGALHSHRIILHLYTRFYGVLKTEGNCNFVMHVSHGRGTELLCAEIGGGGMSCEDRCFVLVCHSEDLPVRVQSSSSTEAY